MGVNLDFNQNLNHYKYFLAVMEEGTVTKASLRLGVRQSTVSYSIDCLQKALGEKLFMVGRHGVMPVRRAELLYQALVPIFSAFDRVLTAFRKGR